MRAGLGIAVLVASAALGLSTSLALRRRLRPRVSQVLFALAGSGLGLGALLPQHHVRAAEWILVPVVLAALSPVHVRLLYAGEGPLRV